MANLMGTYNGQQTLSARNAQASDLASAGKALLSAGILPSSEQAEAMGYTIPQLQLMLAQNQAGQSAGASGGGGGSTTGGAQSSSGGAGKATPTITNRHGDSWVYIPGHGRYSYDEVERGVSSGRIREIYDAENNTYTYVYS